MLKRYWFTFEKLQQPTPLNLGCGVTAFSKEEAIELLKKRVFKNDDLPLVTQCAENIDISTLESNHVRPNMGNPIFHGVWFPLGYD